MGVHSTTIQRRRPFGLTRLLKKKKREREKEMLLREIPSCLMLAHTYTQGILRIFVENSDFEISQQVLSREIR